MLQWFAIQINPQCERRALTGLKERGFTAFLPVETKWKRSRSKARERVDTPLFTGYLFVGLAPGQSLYDVRLQDGVRGVVCGTDGRPAEIVPVLVEGREVHPVYDLQARQLAGEFDKTPAKRSAFSAGDDARILAGPFKGHVGKMLSADDRGRVSLMLAGIFAGGIIVDDDHLEPVTAKAA